MNIQSAFKQTELGMIPEDWEIASVESIASREKHSLSMGPFGSNITKDNFVADGVPVIRGNNLTAFRFLDSDFVFVSENKADELLSSNVKPEDIVITHRGTLGQVGIIPEKSRYKRYVVSQSGMKLTCDNKQVESAFVFYWLKSPRGQQELLKNTSQTGVPAIAQPLSSLRNVLLPKPRIQEQRAIVKILSDLDEKIDLNQQMNQTLEAVAQAIFKHWFIEFEFPNEEGKPYRSSGGELVSSELGFIPKDWRISTIGKEVEIGGGTTPDTSEPGYWDAGTFHWATPKDLSELSGPVLFDTARKITDHGLKAIGGRLYPKGVLLLSSRAPIGYLAISEVPTAINQGMIAIVAEKRVSSFYMLSWCRFNIEEIENRANGTTFLEISKSSFRDMSIIVPPEELMNQFSTTSRSIYSCIASKTKESKILRDLRNSLLPKLMSGKIRVPVEVR